MQTFILLGGEIELKKTHQKKSITGESYLFHRVQNLEYAV